MVINTREYLRNYSKTAEGRDKLKKLFRIALDNGDINEENFWILIFAYVERRMRESTCIKLSVQPTKYNNMLNEALIKINFTINQLDKVRTL